MTRFGSAHGTVGLVKPTYRPGSLEEFVRLLPEGIVVIPLYLDIRRGTREEFARVIDAVEEKVAKLAEIGVDLIHPEGAPAFMLLGPAREREIVSGWERRFGIPVVTAPQTQAEAMRALAMRRIVGITYFTGELNDDFASYLAACGFDVLGMEGIAVPFADVGRLEPAHVRAFARDAFRRHERADGVIGDIVAAAGEETAREATARGANAVAVTADVAREEDAARLVSTARQVFGRLDFLVNCAGNVSLAPVLELSEADWRAVIAVHLTGTFLCCRAAFDAVSEAGGGVVSMSSSYAFKGRPGGAHYSAAKAGIFGFTRVLATELAPRATANVIAPGPIDTPRWRHGLSDAEYAAKRDKRVKEVPMGRLGAPEDIAQAA